MHVADHAGDDDADQCQVWVSTLKPANSIAASVPGTMISLETMIISDTPA